MASAQPPSKKKWLTQAEMGMVSPAIIPLPAMSSTPASNHEGDHDEDGSSSSPRYGILDLPSQPHRRTHSSPQLVTKHHNPKTRSKKVIYQDPGLPTPPSVLVLQTPHIRRQGDYTPAYAYEYSLKYDQDGPHSQRSRPKWDEEEEEEDSDESDEEEEAEEPLPPPKKKKSKTKSGGKAKGSKVKSKAKGKPKVKKRSTKNRRSQDDSESEEEESDEEESESESEEESEESEEDSDYDKRRKTKKRTTPSPKFDKKKAQNMSMSLQFASFGINDNHASRDHYPQHRLSRSEDYTGHSLPSFSPSSRNTPGVIPTKWPADLPHLPRTPGTPADAMSNKPSYNPSGFASGSPTKRDNDYFDYQPRHHHHQQQQQQQRYPQPNSRPQHQHGGSSHTTSTPASAYSTPATSFASMSDQGRRLGQERRYMNLEDPPPAASLRRTPSPAYSPSSHSHTRSLPHTGVNMLSSSIPTSSFPSKAYEQIRSRAEQPPILGQPQTRVQVPAQPVRGSSNFQTSQAFWQQQVQHQPYSSPQPQHRPLPSTSGANSIVIGTSYGAVNGHGTHASSIPALAPQAPSTSTRRRELPPQPTLGRERAQEILNEARERQAQRHNPSPPRPQPQPQPQLLQQQQQQQTAPQHQPQHYPRPQPQPQPQPHQWHPVTRPGTTAPFSSFAPRHPFPPSSFPQKQQQERQPPQTPQPQSQPRPRQTPSIQQHPQPLVQQVQHVQQPRPQQQQQQQQRQSHPLPQPPIQQQQPQRQQQPQSQPRVQQPPLAQRNVYRPPSMLVESPLPVGGRDRVADIPRMGKAASVVDNSTSGYGSGGSASVSASESDAESLRSASQGGSGAIPGIVIDVPGGGGGGGGSGHKTSPAPPPPPPPSSSSSSRTPAIRVQVQDDRDSQRGLVDSSPSTAVPRIQVPNISFTGSEADDGDVHGSGPSISISGPDDTAAHPRPKSQPEPRILIPQWQARPASALPNANVSANRNKGGLLCGGCGGSIIGRTVNAMGVRWHPQCFRCTACDTLLEHVSSYEHQGKPYCHLDYHENFAPRCYHCKTAIIEERFISLDDSALGRRTYHEQHFFCAECGDPFLAPSSVDYENDGRSGELALSGDGEFESDNVGFTVYRGHPYCESCHVRLRLPKCKRCKNSIRDRDRAVEALGGKWCWACFVCESCQKPFDDPAFFQRGEKPYCEPCFSVMLRNEV